MHSIGQSVRALDDRIWEIYIAIYLYRYRYIDIYIRYETIPH